VGLGGVYGDVYHGEDGVRMISEGRVTRDAVERRYASNGLGNDYINDDDYGGIEERRRRFWPVWVPLECLLDIDSSTAFLNRIVDKTSACCESFYTVMISDHSLTLGYVLFFF
jgi:hypothetical protein